MYERKQLILKPGTIFRCCPRCSKTWTGKNNWEDDTKYIGHEEREVTVHPGKMNKGAKYRILLNIREHKNCGGKMTTEGEAEKILFAKVD